MLNEYLQSHLSQIKGDMFIKPYSILKNISMEAAIDEIAKIDLLRTGVA